MRISPPHLFSFFFLNDPPPPDTSPLPLPAALPIGGHRHVREPRHGHGRRAAAQEVVPVHEINRPRGIPGWRDDRIELVLLEHRREPLVARQATDRKSTRLNSSHLVTRMPSSALKKK